MHMTDSHSIFGTLSVVMNLISEQEPGEIFELRFLDKENGEL